MTDGRRFRILGVVDEYTRECLALVADTSISGQRVARELRRIIVWRGKPEAILSDNGTELTSNALEIQKVNLINVRIDRSRRIVLSDVIVEAPRKSVCCVRSSP